MTNKARMSPADEAQVLNEALDNFDWLMSNSAATHELHGRFMGLVDRLFDGDAAAGRLLAALCHRNPVGCAMLLLRENAESYAREVPEARGWSGQWMHVLDEVRAGDGVYSANGLQLALPPMEDPDKGVEWPDWERDERAVERGRWLVEHDFDEHTRRQFAGDGEFARLRDEARERWRDEFDLDRERDHERIRDFTVPAVRHAASVAQCAYAVDHARECPADVRLAYANALADAAQDLARIAHSHARVMAERYKAEHPDERVLDDDETGMFLVVPGSARGAAASNDADASEE